MPEPDADRVIEEAEGILRGESPASLSGPANPDAEPGAPGEREADPPLASPAPAAEDFRDLGALAVCLTDMGFVAVFGPTAAMQGEIREQTVTAWARVLAKYFPAIQSAGPLGALLGCYATHAMICYGNTWANQTATSPASSDGPAVAKQP